MSSIIDEAISGFNHFLKEQKMVEGKANLQTMLFDTEFIVSKLKDIQEVPEFNRETYEPRGATALYDAIGKTIDSEIDRISNLTKEERPSKTLCVILTDGYENSSHEYHQDLIKRKIEEMRNDFNWEFIFLAANQDAMFTADGLGISRGNAMNFDYSGDGVTVAYDSMSKATKHYRMSEETNYDIFEESEKEK
ncbi:MAG: hypothetical protein RQ856_05130 [Candidatus Izemoplasmatales bacterium]|nr:hypothetical protein [Candidatus Izemoplasmatales bacterium]